MAFNCKKCWTRYDYYHCCECRQLFITEEEKPLHCCQCNFIFADPIAHTYHRCGPELNRREVAYERNEQDLVNIIDQQLGIDQEVIEEMDRPVVDDRPVVVDDKFHKCHYANCSEAFSKLIDLEIHNSIHHSEKHFTSHKSESFDPPLIKCGRLGCEKELYSDDKLYKHLCKKHGLHPQFGCWRPGCEREFYSQKRLDFHLREDHALNCWRFNCTRTFPNQEELDSHIKFDHDKLHLVDEPPEFSCPRCNKNFPNEEYLNNHIWYDEHDEQGSDSG